MQSDGGIMGVFFKLACERFSVRKFSAYRIRFLTNGILRNSQTENSEPTAVIA